MRYSHTTHLIFRFIFTTSIYVSCSLVTTACLEGENPAAKEGTTGDDITQEAQEAQAREDGGGNDAQGANAEQAEGDGENNGNEEPPQDEEICSQSKETYDELIKKYPPSFLAVFYHELIGDENEKVDAFAMPFEMRLLEFGFNEPLPLAIRIWWIGCLDYFEANVTNATYQIDPNFSIIADWEATYLDPDALISVGWASHTMSSTILREIKLVEDNIPGICTYHIKYTLGTVIQASAESKALCGYDEKGKKIEYILSPEIRIAAKNEFTVQVKTTNNDDALKFFKKEADENPLEIVNASIVTPDTPIKITSAYDNQGNLTFSWNQDINGCSLNVSSIFVAEVDEERFFHPTKNGEPILTHKWVAFSSSGFLSPLIYGAIQDTDFELVRGTSLEHGKKYLVGVKSSSNCTPNDLDYGLAVFRY